MLSHSVSDPFPDPPPAFNMAAHVLSAAQDRPDKPALVIAGDSPSEMTFGQLRRAVLEQATCLLAKGLRPGDRLLMRLGNTVDFPIIYLASIAVGIVPVPTSAALTKGEVDVLCAQIKPALTVYSDGIACPSSSQPTVHVDDIRPDDTTPMAAFAMGDPDRPAYIIFTSGTSGRPTPVVHAHRAIWARQMMIDGWYGMVDTDRILHAGAFNWTYTLGTGLMDPWTVGATAIVAQDGTPTDALPHLLRQQRATIFAAAPGVYRRMLRGDLSGLTDLRHGLSAGEKLAEDYKSAWQSKTGTDIYEAFGMSECSTFISGAPGHPAPPGASGFAQPGRKVAIIGPDGPVPRGEPGTIAIHKSDPGLMLGYYEAPKETAARFQGDWFMTGDIGIMDSDGAITYAGRADDMMNAGGYRVSPVEVEDALTAHPLISEAAAAAVQIRTGTVIIAGFYVATDVIDEDELRSFVSERLASYKCPRLFVAKDALPRGANNKLLRRVLRAEWEAAYGQT
ncbi:acyl-CoA synthetase (AMP-forming)/AMP-acid ligase II [Yoonia sediminilitoris]|uniref:Acyl-CoA synthetase (AMP-forming)/AMP-acid ligase II n=2 Tax=Yoonia sediminilitoris TaxID=1286148 RepID=A0A2T6KCZ3_9RHOB|nr:class I adenylate-forming enzyme family protein [Yoonia sediminilitoris]PUB12817.1 acyl-CoA synthetase (AMP-forming)/AMP-acid ligase II [Yoonia sediminilitoris]RCW94296.1 acyl-CoA synthetase (AMP-forming)/AMP-acid ligase II [Yoonia sediminilitoris]